MVVEGEPAIQPRKATSKEIQEVCKEAAAFLDKTSRQLQIHLSNESYRIATKLRAIASSDDNKGY